MLIKPPSWVEISKNAFDHNIGTYRSIIGLEKKLAVVIKSNAYGHDTATMAQLCQQQTNVDWICTNSLSEALLTRSVGATKPILVMSLIDDDPDLAIRNNIDLVGHSIEQIKQLNEIGKKLGQPVYIHLKVDTGMSRLGFFPEQLLLSIDQIRQLPFLHIRGIFSHFAESSKANLSYTYYQASRFKEILDIIKNKKIEIPLRHIANSAAIPTIQMKETSMVRLGAGAYGLYPSPANVIFAKKQHKNFTLKPIMTWKTRIFATKKLPAQSFIGYGRTYKTDRETNIGFLPIGYHEGLDKKLSNIGVVLLPNQQQYAPIIGMICMNISIIDLTDIPNTKEGDEVILIGNQPPINPQTIDSILGTNNPRQITTKIINNIPRIIVP